MITQTLDGVAPVSRPFLGGADSDPTLFAQMVHGLSCSAVCSLALAVVLQIASILR